MNADRTLKSILSIISKDVREIKRSAKKVPLSTDTALTLSRYATTLNGIVDAQQKADERRRRELKKLPTAELMKLYMEQQKKEKPK